MSAGHSPLHQFEIQYLTDWAPLAGVNVNLTNSAVYMIATLLTLVAFFALGLRRGALIPGRMQSMAELSYEFIARMVQDNVGKEGKKYFPFIFTLFLFIVTCNFLGLTPYSYTVTSSFAVTFALAAVVFLGVTVIALVRHGTHFVHFFMPAGTPKLILPLIILIELCAYLARPISLSIRLAANMTAGHTMLKVIAGFIVTLGWALGWLPLAFLTVLTGFELFVAILQAYIFAVLTCVYLNDAIHMH